MLAEEALRRRLDAEHAGAEIDAVEIEREDLVLRVARLQIEREHRLLRLALEGAAGIEEQVLGELLGQGRAALDDVAGRHVLDRGAPQSDGIEAQMIAEAAVLDGDEGVGHVVRQRVHVDHGALRQPAARDQTALVVERA